MGRPKSNHLYAVYRDDELLGIGTADELAELLGLSRRTVTWMSTPAARKRAEENPAHMFAIRVEDDEE